MAHHAHAARFSPPLPPLSPPQYKDLIGGEDEGEDPAASTEEEEEEEEEVEDDLCAGMAGMHMGGYGVRPNKRALIVGSSYP